MSANVNGNVKAATVIGNANVATKIGNATDTATPTLKVGAEPVTVNVNANDTVNANVNVNDTATANAKVGLKNGIAADTVSPTNLRVRRAENFSATINRPAKGDFFCARLKKFFMQSKISCENFFGRD